MHFRDILENLNKVLHLTHRIQVSMVSFFELEKEEIPKMLSKGQLELPLVHEPKIITKNVNNIIGYLETTESMLSEIERLTNTIKIAIINFKLQVQKSKALYYRMHISI